MTNRNRLVKDLQIEISDILRRESVPPQVAVEALFDLGCSLACASRRLEKSKLEFRDGLLEAMRKAVDEYLDDPDLQKMAEDYDEAIARRKAGNLGSQQPYRRQDV